MTAARSAAPLPLKIQIGARTLFSIRRRLARVPLSLEDALAKGAPVLAPLCPGEDGWLVTSLPAERLGELQAAIVHVRQRYTRRFVDLTLGEAAWRARLSANTRSGIGRKARRLAAQEGGRLDIERFAAPDEIARFLVEARALSALTYQERLLGAGLPATPPVGEARGWLLRIGGRAAAYLFCTAEGRALRYDHVGHDPALAEWSPGAVLLAEALRDLMGEGRFAWFDFLEGDGQHKRQFATGGVDCCDVLLLSATLANRLTVAALAGWDAWISAAKRVGWLRRIGGKLRR